MSQVAVPKDDVSNSGWTPSSWTSIAARIDALLPGDPDYVESTGDPTDDTFEVQFPPLGVPPEDPDGMIRGPHVVTVRLKKTDTGSVQVSVSLLQSSVVIGAWNILYPTTSYNDSSFSLSQDQINEIGGNYSALRLRVGAGTAATGWAFRSSGGASWTQNGWTVRITFQDSENCGGTNPDTQTGDATARVRLVAPMRLTVTTEGRVERQDAGFDIASVIVDSTLVCSGEGTGENLGCQMATITPNGSIDLAAGDHVIQIHASTVDGQFHVGAYWEFTFAWTPL